MKIEIDTEFQGLIPSLTSDEYEGLKEDIKKDGCRDALIIWNGLILDGHNRYKICNELNLYYKVNKIDLPDRESAKTWIERNQLNRRNLTPDQITLLRGRIYNRMKKPVGGDRKKSKPQNVVLGSTAKKLGSEFNVSHTTIERNGKIAEYLSEHPEEEKKVLQGEKKLTEVKKDRQKMETNKKQDNKIKSKSDNKPYYLTHKRLKFLRDKIDYLITLLNVKATCFTPVSSIKNELKIVKNELNKLQIHK